jgi:hypothetical protein
MRRFYTAAVALLFSFSCNAMATNSLNVDSVINSISRGDHKALNDVPLLTEKISIEKSNDLRKALSHSLIISTPETLDALNIIDKNISEKGHSFLRDKFGTDSICSYVIDSNKYDRESFFKYYSKAKVNLEQTGDKGKSCLDLMNSSIEEIIYEEKQGKIKWGVDKYVFD